MNILLIAPDHVDLPNVDFEIAAITKNHQVKLLVGKVREVDIQEALSKDDEFDVIWLATHGNDTEILLSTETLSSDALGQYVRMSNASLCVLNSCSSEHLALRIAATGRADVIYTSSDVKDNDALRFGVFLATELAKNDNIEEVFNLVAPDRGDYHYIKTSDQVRGIGYSQTNIDRLNKLELVIFGDARLKLVGLLDLVKNLQETVEKTLPTNRDSRLSEMMIYIITGLVILSVVIDVWRTLQR